MIIQVLQVMALILAIESAIFLSKGNLGLSASVIAELSSTKYGFNSSVIKNLANQNADNWIGVILLLISVVLQMFTILYPSQASPSFIDLNSLIISLVICTIIYFICWRLSLIRSARLYKQSKEIIDTKIQSYKKAG